MRLKIAIIVAAILAVPSAASAHRTHPTRAQWECIHKHEAPPWSGGWRANTGNGYYGGLQANHQFELNYGREFWRKWGHANN